MIILHFVPVSGAHRTQCRQIACTPFGIILRRSIDVVVVVGVESAGQRIGHVEKHGDDGCRFRRNAADKSAL